jgi:hypothetical protein
MSNLCLHNRELHNSHALILICERQTGMYYLRTKPAVNAIQYTVENEVSSNMQVLDDSEVCVSCQS